MKKPIKVSICELYDDISLSQEELDTIRKSPETERIQHRSKTQFQMIRISSIVAIACTLVISASIWLLSPTLNMSFSKTDNIVADVIDNHLLHKTLLYRTDSLSELNNNFSYLGFILSKVIPAEQDGELLGARPCFILNIPAAQLRYQKSPNLWTTVFQTRYQKDIYGPIPDIKSKESPLVKIDRGVQVNLWRENGLLFAVAKTNQ
jgi:hypothetical protein